MLALILKFWQIGVGLIIASAIWLLILNWDISRLESKYKQGLTDQVKTDRALCDLAQSTTRESNEYYQNIIAARNADITELSKRPERCLYIRPTNNTASPEGKLHEARGLPSSVLYRLGSLCETERAGNATLQNYLTKVQCNPMKEK